ncbi:MAG: hypothetical protein JST54_17330 [Deltaproteobacteria bacterium]|nr:hypothetical protein [Deltaproteobacteria bacterium]
MASKRAVVGVALAAMLLAGRAQAAEVPVNFGVGDLKLKQGMVLHLMRHQGNKDVVVGRLRVVNLDGDAVQLELLSGTAEMQNGDHIEVERPKVKRHH